VRALQAVLGMRGMCRSLFRPAGAFEIYPRDVRPPSRLDSSRMRPPRTEQLGALYWFARGLERRRQRDLPARTHRLRVSEATGADIEHLGLELGQRHPSQSPARAGKVVPIPLAATARAVNGHRREHRRTPLHPRVADNGWTGTAPPARREYPARRDPPAGQPSLQAETRVHHAFLGPPSRAGVPLATAEAASHADPSTTMRYARARHSLTARHLHRRHNLQAEIVGSSAVDPGRGMAAAARQTPRPRIYVFG